MAESSREELAKLEALYANNPEGRVFTHLAEAYRKAGELDRARSILEDGLTKHAGYASAHVVLGRVLLDQQKSDEAADAFRRVLSLDPHNHVALRSLGDIARSAGRSEEALQYFQELQHLDPGNEDIQQILSELNTSLQSEPEPEPEPAAAPDFEHPEPLAQTPEAIAFEPLEPEALPQMTTIDLGSDMNLDWVPDVEPESESGLPGDLGELVGFAAPEPEPEPEPIAEFEPVAEAEPELEAEEEPVFDLPTFDEPEPEPTGEVLTETIAELYRSQGLYDRSADVYRALLQQRPGDETLTARLQEVEEMAAAPAIPIEDLAPAAAAEVAPQPESAPEAEAWLAGAAGTAESAPTPYAWAEQPAGKDDDAGPPIRSYFERLLAWRPAARPQDIPELEMEPDTMLLLDQEVVTESVGTEGFYDVQEPPPPAPEPPAADPWMSAEPPAIQEPWESPAPVVPEPAAAAPEPAAAAPEPPAPVTPAPVTPAPQAPMSTADNSGDAFDEWFGAPEPTTPAAPPPPSPSEDSPSSDDDDDLEMFRSWLQSLKK